MSILSAATNHRQAAFIVWSPDRTRKLHLPVLVALIRFDLADMHRAMVSLGKEGLRNPDGFEVLEVHRANYHFRGPRSNFHQASTALRARINDVLAGDVTAVHDLKLMPHEARFEALFQRQGVAA